MAGTNDLSFVATNSSMAESAVLQEVDALMQRCGAANVESLWTCFAKPLHTAAAASFSAARCNRTPPCVISLNFTF